ncbi:MAG TPA: response regulator [Candidatus Limnocylindria bacterium]|nr:response regulator [Candidatus Limnocylindria bacterium]
MKSVLIAEDDPDVANVLRTAIVDRLPVSADIVPNGALVLDALAESRRDLLILDLSLPGLNGIDVFDLMRSDPSSHGIPVLFITGSPEKAEHAVAPTGVHEVLAKPFDVDELVQRVRRLIGEPEAVAAAA